jgi:hypothetical protein
VSDAREAALTVLREAGEPLHWTVVLDRALRGGHLDPFTTPDVRGTMQRALMDLAREGALVKPAKGMYALADQGR